MVNPNPKDILEAFWRVVAFLDQEEPTIYQGVLDKCALIEHSPFLCALLLLHPRLVVNLPGTCVKSLRQGVGMRDPYSVLSTEEEVLEAERHQDHGRQISKHPLYLKWKEGKR